MVAVPLTATYATAGTYTWTCPPGVTSVLVACQGAGGGGGAASGTSGSNGGGGGGGEAALEGAVAVTPGLGYPVVVGAGGAGGTAGGNGAAGGDTSFAGDSVTVVAHGAPGGTAAVTGSGQGAEGGTGSVNSVSADGGDSDAGTVSSNGGGGGGAAGVNQLGGFFGGDASGSTAGTGGAGQFPGGAGGAGSTSGAGPGSNGSGPGGGGGGALSTGTGRAGGSGADGQVVITWTMTDPVTLVNNTDGGVFKFQAPLGASAVKAECWGGGAGGYNSGTSGGAGVAGFTAFPSTYGGTQQQAADTVDGYVGRPVALAAQNVYFTEGQWPTTADNPKPVQTLTNMGVKVMVLFRPSRQAVLTGGGTLAAEQANLAAACDLFNAVPGVNWYACLWQECNAFGEHGPFGDGTMKPGGPNPSPYGGPGTVSVQQAALNYQAYCAAYAPTLHTKGVQILWKPVVFATGAAILFFPGAGSANNGVDFILADWYSQDYLSAKQNDLFGANNIEGLADANGLALGIGEWGAAGGNVPPSVSDYQNIWVPHFIGGFQARINAGKPVADIIYYGGQNLGGPNVITGASDYKVPGIQQAYDLLSQVQPLGGAGGGGGEYAAESSLAITSLSSYVIAVGAGGAHKNSGENSTAAGDSVTVTAHGGSVATTPGTGGAGGSGSTNATHHAGAAGGAGGGAGGGGGGGGGSGGTSSAGNAGAAGGANFGGAGGVAVTGGGPGGKGGGPNANGSPPPSGPGGGGAARGASGITNGAGFDGQLTLSNFNVGVGSTGSFGLAPLGFNGTAGAPSGAFALGALATSATGTVTRFSQVQLGTVASGTGSAAPTCSATSNSNTVFAVAATTGTTAITAPAPWVQDVSQQQGAGGGGIISIWRYPASNGSITGATFTGGGGDTIRAYLIEVAAPTGYTPALDGTPGTASGTTGVTSFPVTNGSSTGVADMAIAAFLDRFSSNTTGSWTTPSGWSLLRSQASAITNWIAGYAQYATAAGTLSVTGTASTSTNQTGWGAVIATYKAVPLNTSSGSFGLAGLGFSAAGNAVLGPGQVATSGGLALGPLGFQSPSTATTFPSSPLPVLVEILINGTWTDISGYVYQRDGIKISQRGRPDESQTAQPAQVTMTLNNRDGSFSPQNSAGQFYPFLVRNTQLRISVVNAVTPTGANYTGYRWWGEVPAWPPLWDPTGTDIYVSITAAGVLQRMRQSKYSASPLTRYYTNIINAAALAPGSQAAALVPAGYWPCEDASGSGSFSSGIPGGSPMTYTGTPGLAADTSVAGSAAFAQLSSSVWTGTPGAFSSGGITFATPGTFAWVCPGGVTSVLAECWGAGGGGSDGRFGCGGGGGEYAAEPALAVTPGKIYTLVVGAGGAGGAGTFSLKGNAGLPGGMTTFSGDTVTVVANGGRGLSASSGHAAGGSGSANTTHHNGGQGGQFRSAGQGGSGGGGSGGNSSAGNTGGRANSASGASGGAAVTDGGPGGTGGLGAGTTGQALPGNSPSPGPGGGGGGGGFNQSNQFGERGGNGFAGQVRLTFGTSTQPPATVLRFIADVGSTGATDGAYFAQATTSGTIADLHVKYHTGGNLELIGKDKNNSQLFTSGSHSFSLNGHPALISAELVQAGTSVNWKLTALQPGATAVVATYTGTQANATLGAVTQVNVNNAPADPDTTTTGIGHVAVQYAVDPILNLSQALAAYNGELAATRFLRLCGEQQVPAALTGNITDTPQMGPQPPGLLVDLLQDCENADLGQMFEQRGAFGLGYRTRTSLQNQAPSVVLDYSLSQLAQGLAPTNDDQLSRNDIIATRSNGVTTGTSYEQFLQTGAMSVQDPPNGIGLYSYSVTVNLFSDAQIPGFVQWLLAIGTLDEFRYPLITVDMRRAEVSGGTFGAMASLDVGDYLQILNPPSWLPQYPINQLAFGFTEDLNAFEWTIAVNAVPEDPYASGPSAASLPIW